MREAWFPDRQSSFSVEHVAPQVSAPDRVCDYENMLYSCNACNSAKQDVEEILDPTAAPLAHHIHVRDDGTIHGLSPDGQDLIDLLGLNREPRSRMRRYYLDLVALKRQRPGDDLVHRLFMHAFGYPELNDLPDPTGLRPPGGNLRKGSELNCFRKRRVEGRLMAYY